VQQVKQTTLNINSVGKANNKENNIQTLHRNIAHLKHKLTLTGQQAVIIYTHHILKSWGFVQYLCLQISLQARNPS